MTRLEKEMVLERIYYDVDEGFASVRDLYEKARKVDVGITLDMVSTWMRAQPNKQTRNYKNYNSYAAPFPKYEFQIDLMDVTSLLRDVGSEIKSQLRYGLLCMDIFSKKCHIVPVENKGGDDVYKAVMECFKVLGQRLSIYSDDEGALNSKKLQTFFKEQGITHLITNTDANQAERKIRTVKKMIGDRLRHCKNKACVEVLKPSLNRYNNQIHGSTKTTPNNAHNLDNVIQVGTNLILKEKYNRKYPNIKGDYVTIFDKGKGSYVSRKETRNQWSERKYKVILVDSDMMNNRYYILDGMSKKYNRHELLVVDWELFFFLFSPFSVFCSYFIFLSLVSFFCCCLIGSLFPSLYFKLFSLYYLYFSSVLVFCFFVLVMLFAFFFVFFNVPYLSSWRPFVSSRWCSPVAS